MHNTTMLKFVSNLCVSQKMAMTNEEFIKNHYFNVFKQSIYDIHNDKIIRQSYKKIKEKNYSYDLGGYLPDPLSNITNIKLFIEGLYNKFDNVVVFAVDAISFNYFYHKASSKIGKNVKNNGHLGVISSIFPSTTGAAWPSIITGTTPSEHGVYGTSFLHEKYRKNYIWISNTLNHKGERLQINSNDDLKINLSNSATIFEEVSKKGVNSYYFGTHGSGMTNPYREELTRGALHAEPVIENYLEMKRNPVDLFNYFSVKIKKILGKINEKKLIWNYIDFDDYIHENGYVKLDQTFHWELMFELWDEIKSDNTVIVFVADHGQVPQTILDTNILKLSGESNLLEFNTGGAGRVLYFYPYAEKEQEFIFWIKGIIGTTGNIYTREQIIKLGLIEENAVGIDRIGKYIVIGRDANFPSTGAPTYVHEHGALNEDEMFVPILVY